MRETFFSTNLPRLMTNSKRNKESKESSCDKDRRKSRVEEEKDLEKRMNSIITILKMNKVQHI